MGRGSMGGGFLDFCGRKKPPVGGRAERGRGAGAGRGEGQEVGENCLLQAEGEGRAGREEGWDCLCLVCSAGAEPREWPKCAQGGQLPAR